MNLSLLRAERVGRGITQEAIADYLGFKDKSSYCLMEKGKTAINVETARKISVFLGLTQEQTYNIFFAPEVQESST